jgi:sugar phosphate isomerase/epimerase
MQLLAGLCSITLRALPAAEVLAIAAEAGLEAIEWGGDVHCTPGTDGAALAQTCRDAGIACPSYGSYFMAGQTDPGELDAIFDTAESLGATTVRVWARFGVQPQSPAEEKAPVVEALAHAARAGAERGLRVGVEYHDGTLSETIESAMAMLGDAGEPLLSYWQPHPDPVAETSRAELDALAPRLAHVHVFSWTGSEMARRPMRECDAYWRAVLPHAATRQGPAGFARAAYLEYVPDDSGESVAREAGYLREVLSSLEG